MQNKEEEKARGKTIKPLPRSTQNVSSAQYKKMHEHYFRVWVITVEYFTRRGSLQMHTSSGISQEYDGRDGTHQSDEDRVDYGGSVVALVLPAVADVGAAPETGPVVAGSVLVHVGRTLADYPPSWLLCKKQVKFNYGLLLACNSGTIKK